MICTECGASTKVTDSRVVEKTVYRRRKCPNGHKFTTFEIVMPEGSTLEYLQKRRKALKQKVVIDANAT